MWCTFIHFIGGITRNQWWPTCFITHWHSCIIKIQWKPSSAIYCTVLLCEYFLAPLLERPAAPFPTCPHSLDWRGEEHQCNETWSSDCFSLASPASLHTLNSLKSLRGISAVITHCLCSLILSLGVLNSWKFHKIHPCPQHLPRLFDFIWCYSSHCVLSTSDQNNSVLKL